MTNIVMSSEDDAKEKQSSIVVPIDDMDTVSSDSPSTVDELAMELATIQQSAKRIAIIGSRNLPITHQQMIETLTTALVMQGNTIITSGGSSGTNAAAIRGAMKANPDKLKVICRKQSVSSRVTFKTSLSEFLILLNILTEL